MWISVRNWRKFQHYDPTKRQPPWIKNYTELLSSDAYLSLSAGARAVLHGIWIAYASSQCELSLGAASTQSRLSLDTVSLSRRLNLRVTKQHIESLNHAGFIDIVASKMLAEGYQDASARAHDVEVEEEEEEERPSFLPTLEVHVEQEGRTSTRKPTEAEIVSERELGNGTNPLIPALPDPEGIPF